jgi:replication-associated recombination protein RarA
MYQIKTFRGYDFGEATSAMQKAIRRGDAKIAGYFAVELFESNYREYVWRRLLTISAEDCWGILTQEVWALFEAWREIDKAKKGKGRIFVAKAVLLLCQAKKSRDADHLTNLVYDAKRLPEADIETAIAEARADRHDIPEYAMDCHTRKGKMAGMTKADFFQTEHAALQPREPGLFDGMVTQ